MENFENQQDFNQNSVGHLEPIKVRCPDCLKLYAVNPSEIKNTRPKFECIKCQTRFWFPYPETLGSETTMGLPVEWLESNDAHQQEELPEIGQEIPNQFVEPATPHPPKDHSPALVKCLSCDFEQPGGQEECQNCGIVMKKAEIRQEWKSKGIIGDEDLLKRWKLLLEDYDNRSKHELFILNCREKDNLTFAAHQYRKMLEIHSGDEVALQMQSMITALTEHQISQFPQTKKRKPISFSLVLSLVGGLFIGVGYVLPNLRNLIGIGVAIIFLVLAIRFYFFKD